MYINAHVGAKSSARLQLYIAELLYPMHTYMHHFVGTNVLYDMSDSKSFEQRSSPTPYQNSMKLDM